MRISHWRNRSSEIRSNASFCGSQVRIALAEDSARRQHLKKDWIETPRSFHKFLNWLDEGVDSGGERYLDMRRRLVAYFDRKRTRAPDELADETLNRVARRLEEEGAITDTPPARYCYIVARFVFLEYVRREPIQSNLADLTLAAPRGPDAVAEQREQLLDRVDRCLQRLDADERTLILEYYQGEQRTKIEQRRRLAARLGLTPNALSIRACRIRGRLEACVLAGERRS